MKTKIFQTIGPEFPIMEALDSIWESNEMTPVRELITPTEIIDFPAYPDKDCGYTRYCFTHKGTKALTYKQLKLIKDSLDNILLTRDDGDPLEPNHWYTEINHPHKGETVYDFYILKAWSC